MCLCVQKKNLAGPFTLWLVYLCPPVLLSKYSTIFHLGMDGIVRLNKSPYFYTKSFYFKECKGLLKYYVITLGEGVRQSIMIDYTFYIGAEGDKVLKF